MELNLKICGFEQCFESIDHLLVTSVYRCEFTSALRGLTPQNYRVKISFIYFSLVFFQCSVFAVLINVVSQGLFCCNAVPLYPDILRVLWM